VRFVTIDDVLYEIVAQTPENIAIDTESLKRQYRADIVLRRDNIHYLARIVQEAEFEDIKVTTNERE
tara:strand:+ start:1561 stop:1761 length:201 start_codon:yes stop_codon:yes gene_type:complete